MTSRSFMIQTRLLLILSFVSALLVGVMLFPTNAQAAAPGDVVGCSDIQNLSNSPGFTSADPLLVADPYGHVHLFWAERISGQPNTSPNVPDALMHSVWNGYRWSEPRDLFLSPTERFTHRINGIRGLLGEDGLMHLVWIGPENLFFYSAGSPIGADVAGNWREPMELADDQSGNQYSVDIAFAEPETLHVAYGRGIEGSGTNHSVSYRRSEDGGLTWSDPDDVYVIPQLNRGASNVRILANGPENVYVSWTVWDESGNGQAIYFARSIDGGDSWEEPILLDRRQGNEYERDWTTVEVLEGDQLVAFWEGGWRAYRQAQYSDDGGATWSEPKDTLDWLIADNGFAEFVRDGSGRLHLFVFQRVREGNNDKGDREGLWHTVWEGGREWRQPDLVGNPSGGNFVTVDISRGNQLFAAWFDYTNFEIFVIRCQIEGVDPITPAPLPEDTDPASAIVDSNAGANDEDVITSEAAVTPASPLEDTTSNTRITNLEPPADNDSPLQEPTLLIIVSVLPALVLVTIIMAVVIVRRRSSF